MAEEINNATKTGGASGCGKKSRCNQAGGAVYGLGFIGAAIYFIQAAPTFWLGVLGFLKAIVWPVFVVYKLLGFLAP